MRTFTKVIALLFISCALWAETPITEVSTDTAPPVSTVVDLSTPIVHVSTTPPSVAITGETTGVPIPYAVTESSGSGRFVTLTRTALSTQELPTNTQIITQEEIRSHNAQTVGDILKYATSLQIPTLGTVGSPQEAGIRGGSSRDTQILIDGRPIGGTVLSGSQDLAEIPVEQVDHIEIVRSGASALFGPNALGGVINIITKRATYSGVPLSHLSFQTGTFDRQSTRLDFGSRVGPVDYFFFGDTQRESGFRDNSSARTHTIGGNAGLSMGAGGKLLFDASSYHAEAGVPGALSPDLNPSQFNNEIEKMATTLNANQTTDTNYLRTSYLLPLPMDSLLSLRAFGSQREVAYTNPDPLSPADTDRHEQTKGVDAQVSLPLGLLVGGNFLHDREDSTDMILSTNSFIASAENWGLFAQDTMQWKTLTLIPSGRYDHNSLFGDTKNPRVELMEDVTDWLRFSGDAGRSFRTPTLDELYAPLQTYPQFGGITYQGNPALQPETAWTYDGGFELHEDSLTFKATYFRSNIHDLIQTTADAASTTVNIDNARRQGAEVEVTHVLSEQFKDRWNYTYLKSEGMPLGFDRWIPLLMSPRHTVNYVATYQPVKNITFDTTLKYESSEYSDNNESGTKIGDHLICNLRLSYMWRQLQLYVGMDDVANKRYEESAGFPLPGRTTYAGFQLHLWG